MDLTRIAFAKEGGEDAALATEGPFGCVEMHLFAVISGTIAMQ